MSEYELAIITVYLKGGLAALLAAGGIYALNRGYHLVNQGKGNRQDHNFIKVLGFSAGSGTVGSLVMITSCVWGLLAYQTRPTFEGRTVRVAQSALPKELSTRLIALAAENLKSDDRAVKFAAANVLANARDPKATAALVAALDRKDTVLLEALATALEPRHSGAENALFDQWID